MSTDMKRRTPWSTARKLRMWRTICLAGFMGSGFGWIWELMVR